jgi:hypothetical protein
MVASIVVGVIVFIIGLVIFLEYRNEKRYRQERQRAKEKQQRKIKPKVIKRPIAPHSGEKESQPSSTHPKPDTSIPVNRKTPRKEITVSTPEHDDPKEEKPERKLSKAPLKPEKTTLAKAPRSIPSKAPETKTEKDAGKEPTQEQKKNIPSTELPKGEYPDFNYERLIGMGLSEEEALEFIQELIPQIGEQIPLIDDAMKIPDFHKMERLTHSIKGSSTTIGTGGVSDLLVEYNTYLKTGTELPIAEAYQAHLKRYFEKLKKQFPPKKS